ncbi:hypothetical protein LBMAG42_15610 [Deltaproteobacteria bacterium]|nr:hypothetical protein LBMAG42_15610 [Deltaproteobacteria bacterium]
MLNTPFRIASLYVLLGLVWIAASDRVAAALTAGSTPLLVLVSTWKGSLFVVITGLGLLMLLTRWSRRMEAAHEAALVGEREYRRLFDDSPLPAWVYAIDDLRILEVNEAAVARYGYSREEFRALTVRQVRPESEIGKFEAGFVTSPTQRDVLFNAGEWIHQAKDGQRLNVEISWRNVIHRGRAARLAVMRDLTEQRAAEARLAETEQGFQDMLGAMNEAIWIGDPTLRVCYFISPAIEEICGIPAVEFRADPSVWLRQLHPEDAGRVQAEVAGIGSAGETVVSTFRIYRRDGALRWLEVAASAVCNRRGEVVRVIGITTDITERKRLEDEVSLAAQVFADTREGVIITDVNERILRVNRSFQAMTGYSEAELLGETPRILKSGLQNASYYQEMRAVLARDGHWEGQLWDRRKNGETYPVRLSITEVRNAEGRPTHYIGISADLTETRRAEARIENLANFDAVTGLANRTRFEARLTSEIEVCATAGLAVLLVGIDRFMVINQTVGHAAGDMVLADVGQRLQLAVPVGATLARFGGERFLVLLASGTPMAKVRELANELVHVVVPGAASLRSPFPLTACVGIAQYPSDGITAADLLKSAESALNQAKGLGHGNVATYCAAMDARATERIATESRLRAAMEQGRLELHYQPQISLAVNRCSAVEALLRWTDPEWGPVSPVTFIPVAEACGLIVPLGDWVLGEACRQARRWLDAGRPVVVAVNISVIQFRAANFVDKVREALAAVGLPAHLLELEVTESVVMDGASTVATTLAALRELGVHLSIDDFGTGYSSLAYLRRFPIDKLKIDQSFVREMLHDADAAAITQAVVSLAKSLRLQVIAEGVETQE